jgi:hypothetical protein
MDHRRRAIPSGDSGGTIHPRWEKWKSGELRAFPRMRCGWRGLGRQRALVLVLGRSGDAAK